MILYWRVILALRLTLQSTQFVKLCRDVSLVGTSLSEASPPLNDADIQVMYTAEVKKRDRDFQKMNYNDFLTALMKVRRVELTQRAVLVGTFPYCRVNAVEYNTVCACGLGVFACFS